MVIFPQAKINIGLRVIEKRTDGFHNIETIFYPVCLCDALEFIVPEEPLKEDILTLTGLMTGQDPADNLVIKAVRKIRELKAIPFLKLHLHKAIPAGAGLGGGSSDASALMNSLNKYFDQGTTGDGLKKISLDLGSDCPFFIDPVPSFAEGRGEILTPLPPLQKGLFLVLVNPGIHINTREAYGNIKPGRSESDLRELYRLDISKWKDQIINDFEASVFKMHPQIRKIKERLYEMGAIYSSMSGSGSTVYGIFQKKPVIPESLNKFVIYSERL
jgi:4-diphosphocytidyl-2-C-methyl-D-erythritol kinase